MQGTLTVLTIWTLVLDFQKNSPFADMLPSTSDFFARPLTSLYMVIEVLRLHEAHKSAQIAEKRKRYVEDVAKRRAYRKAHGLPEEVGLFNQPMARIKTDEEIEEEKRKAAEEKEQQRLQDEEETKRRTDPEVRPLTEEERQSLIDCVAVMTERELTCWLLHMAHGLTFQEIGDRLGLSRHTVRVFVDRAKAKVRERLIS